MTEDDPSPNRSTSSFGEYRTAPPADDPDVQTPIYDDTLRTFLHARSLSSSPRPPAADPSSTSVTPMASNQPAAEISRDRTDTLKLDTEDRISLRASMIDATVDTRSSKDEVADRQLLFDLVDQLTHTDTAPGTSADLDNTINLDDATIVRLCCALHDARTRDAYLARTLDTPQQCAPLMAFLTRALPAPERAVPASLLAVHAFLCDDDDYARIATAVAADADPDNAWAQCLLRIMRQHVAPDIRHRVIDAIRIAAQGAAANPDRA